MSDIKIYTTNWCSYCNFAKRYFDEQGKSYEEINIEKEGIRRKELMNLPGGMSVPQIVIDGKPISGYDDLMSLVRAGEIPV